MIWLAKYDLTTPAVAALLHCGTECYLSASEQWRLDEQLRRRLEERSRAADERAASRRRGEDV
jgi:hypothetical protein